MACVSPTLHVRLFEDATVRITPVFGQSLYVEVTTKRLRILSVNDKTYLPQLIALFGDKEVNASVGDGSTKTAAEVTAKVERWIKRWSQHNPYAGYVVVTIPEGQKPAEFVGQIIVKPVKDKKPKPCDIEQEVTFLPGVAEIGYLSAKASWGKGFGNEYTYAIIYDLIPRLIKQGYQVKGHVLSKLIATARVDNNASNALLQKFMTYEGEKPRYSGMRKWYRVCYPESCTDVHCKSIQLKRV